MLFDKHLVNLFLLIENQEEQEITQSKAIDLCEIANKCPYNVCNIPCECQTYRTILVNYNLAQEQTGIAVMPILEEIHKPIIATISIGPALRSESQFDVFNLRKLYQMSGHSLRSGTRNSSTTCQASTSRATTSASLGEKSNQTSIHSIKIDIFKIPATQHAHTEEYPLHEVKTSEVVDSNSSSTKITTNDRISNGNEAKRNQVSSSSHSLKIEVFKLPSEPETKCEDYVFAKPADIIVITSGDSNDLLSVQTQVSDMELESNNHKETEISSNSIPSFCFNQKKQTQKSETLGDSVTQDSVEIPKLSKTPSSSSSVHDSSGARTSPVPGTHKERQLELHRLRVQVEKKRLELLETKLRREREEIIREQEVFERDMRLIGLAFKELNDEKDV